MLCYRRARGVGGHPARAVRAVGQAAGRRHRRRQVRQGADGRPAADGADRLPGRRAELGRRGRAAAHDGHRAVRRANQGRRGRGRQGRRVRPQVARVRRGGLEQAGPAHAGQLRRGRVVLVAGGAAVRGARGQARRARVRGGAAAAPGGGQPHRRRHALQRRGLGRAGRAARVVDPRHVIFGAVRRCCRPVDIRRGGGARSRAAQDAQPRGRRERRRADAPCQASEPEHCRCCCGRRCCAQRLRRTAGTGGTSTFRASTAARSATSCTRARTACAPR